MNGNADEALAQIREKNYAAPFAKNSRPVYLIGVNFSDELRNIQEVKVEKNYRFYKLECSTYLQDIRNYHRLYIRLRIVYLTIGGEIFIQIT